MHFTDGCVSYMAKYGSWPVGVLRGGRETPWAEIGATTCDVREGGAFDVWEETSDKISSSISSFLLPPISLLQFPINNSRTLKDSWRVLNLREIPEA